MLAHLGVPLVEGAALVSSRNPNIDKYYRIEDLFQAWAMEGRLKHELPYYKKDGSYVGLHAMLQFFTITEGVGSSIGIMRLLQDKPEKIDWLLGPHAYAIYRAKLAKVKE